MWYVIDDEFVIGPLETEELAEQTKKEWEMLWEKWRGTGQLRDITIRAMGPDEVVDMIQGDFKYINRNDMEKEVRTYTTPVIRKQVEEDLRDSGGLKLAKLADKYDRQGLYYLANTLDKALGQKLAGVM